MLFYAFASSEFEYPRNFVDCLVSLWLALYLYSLHRIQLCRLNLSDGGGWPAATGKDTMQCKEDWMGVTPFALCAFYHRRDFSGLLNYHPMWFYLDINCCNVVGKVWSVEIIFDIAQIIQDCSFTITDLQWATSNIFLTLDQIVN